MRYLRTNFGTDFQTCAPTSLVGRLLENLNPNPDYDLSLVREWLIEFGDDDFPWREIGLDDEGIPVLAGPDSRNYGFWLDTNMQYKDFIGTEMNADEFNGYWTNWLASR